MAQLQKVGVLFLAKLFAIVMAFFGLIASAVYSFGGAIYDIVTTQGLNRGTALAFLSLVGTPALIAVVGFIVGAIGAPVYNYWTRS